MFHAIAFHMKKAPPTATNRAGDPQQSLSPRPSVDRADADPQRMQASGRNDEAHAVEQSALAGRQFGSVRMPVEDGEEANQRRRDTQRRAHFEHHRGTEQEWPRERCHTRFPAAARPSVPAFRRTPSPWETQPAEPKSPEHRVARPTDRRRPSPARDRVPRSDGESRSGIQRLRPSGDGRRQSSAHRTTSASPASSPGTKIAPPQRCSSRRLRRAMPLAARSRTRRASLRCIREAPAPIAASALRVCGTSVRAPESAR